VAIFGNDRFFGDGKFFHSFECFDPERCVSLGGNTRIVALELSKLDSVAGKPIAEMGNREMWAMFFKYLTYPKMRAAINAIIERAGQQHLLFWGGLEQVKSTICLYSVTCRSLLQYPNWKKRLHIAMKATDSRRKTADGVCGNSLWASFSL